MRSKNRLRLIIGFTLLGQMGIASAAYGSPVSAEIEALAAQCAPTVDHKTLAYIVAHESSNRQYAINVNYGSPQLDRQPQSRAETLTAIRSLEAAGINYDLGVAQINSSNFDMLGVTPAELLDPCKNIASGAHILTDCYQRASRRTTNEQLALRQALSCYNTGSFERGFSNGYVQRIERVAQQAPTAPLVPRLLLESQEVIERVAVNQVNQTSQIPNESAESDILGDAFNQSVTSAFQRAPKGAFN